MTDLKPGRRVRVVNDDTTLPIGTEGVIVVGDETALAHIEPGESVAIFPTESAVQHYVRTNLLPAAKNSYSVQVDTIDEQENA